VLAPPKVVDFVIEILDRAFGPRIGGGELGPELEEMIARAERDLARWEESGG
jgi:hypothetical protein